MESITAWKCIKCGRVLTTAGGVKRHQEKCKYIPQVLEGQLKFEDMLDNGAGENISAAREA